MDRINNMYSQVPHSVTQGLFDDKLQTCHRCRNERLQQEQLGIPFLNRLVALSSVKGCRRVVFLQTGSRNNQIAKRRARARIFPTYKGLKRSGDLSHSRPYEPFLPVFHACRDVVVLPVLQKVAGIRAVGDLRVHHERLELELQRVFIPAARPLVARVDVFQGCHRLPD